MRLNNFNLIVFTFCVCREWSWCWNWFVLWIPDEGLYSSRRWCFPAEVQHRESSISKLYSTILAPAVSFFLLRNHLQTLCCFMLEPFNNVDAFSMWSVTALQCHYEVHQSASLAAQRAHAQPHCECPQLDGLPARVLPWITGQILCLTRGAAIITLTFENDKGK